MRQYDSLYGGLADGILSGMEIGDRIGKKRAVSALFDQGQKEGEQLRQNDLNNYDNQRASLFEGGYNPSQEEMQALDNGYQTLQAQKPSQLFNDSIMGMSSQERLGHMVQLAQQGGLKINDATLNALQGVNSIYDNMQAQDMQHQTQLFNLAEAKKKAEEEAKSKETMGRATYQMFSQDPKYKGLFGDATPDSYASYSGLAPMLFKDSQANDRLQNMLLLQGMKGDTATQIAAAHDDTKQLVAGIVHSGNSNNDFYKSESLRLRQEEIKRQQEKDKAEAELKAQVSKDAQFKNRKEYATKTLKDDKTFRMLSPEDQDKVTSYYGNYGVMPQTKTVGGGLFSGKQYIYNLTPPAVNPTNTARNTGQSPTKKQGDPLGLR